MNAFEIISFEYQCSSQWLNSGLGFRKIENVSFLDFNIMNDNNSYWQVLNSKSATSIVIEQYPTSYGSILILQKLC